MSAVRTLFAAFLIVLASPGLIWLFTLDMLSEATGVAAIHAAWIKRLEEFLEDEG